MRRWKKIEGPGGEKQILKIWRHNFEQKIEFQDLLAKIDEEFHLSFSRRTKINYLNQLVKKKLLGWKKKGRETFYWPLQLEEVVRACLLDLISNTPKDHVLPSGFLTFFGFNLDDLTAAEKIELRKIKGEAEAAFRGLMQFKGEIWRRKLRTEWDSVIKNKEIHVIIKWILWCGTTYSLLYYSGLLRVPKEEKVLPWSHVLGSIEHLCKLHGIEIPLKKRRLLNKKVSQVWKKHTERFQKLARVFGQIWHKEGTTPLVMVGATPIRKTRLGKEVFRLSHTLEKDFVETLLSQIDEHKRPQYEKQVHKLTTDMKDLSEKQKESQKTVQLSAFFDVLSKEQLELEVCNWVNSKIL